MNLVEHCELCDHQKASLKAGTTCGLTAKKPDFNKTCSNITLSEKFERKLKKINIELYKVKKEKKKTYIYISVFTAIALGFFIYGYLLKKYVLTDLFLKYDRFILDPSFEIIGIGFLPLLIAFRILKRFKRKIEIAKSRKDEIDQILNEYGIKYSIDFKDGKEIHGTKSVSTELKINERS